MCIRDRNKEAAEKKVETLQDEMTSLMAEINTLEEELVQTGQEIIKATDDLQKAEEKEKTHYEEMCIRDRLSCVWQVSKQTRSFSLWTTPS